jgi:hypothetical protein
LTRQKVEYLNSSLSGSYAFNKDDQSGNISKSYHPDFEITANGVERLYRKNEKYFIEGTFDVNYRYSYFKTINNSINNGHNTDNQLSLSLGFGCGVGRMEKVTDLWQSYFILKKLQQQNSLSRDLTDEDIFGFAKLASQLKNKRFFDSRLRKIAELQALDSLVREKKLVENTDIAYFTTLNDYWSYGIFPDRQSGHVLKFNVAPYYYLVNFDTSYSPAETSHRTSVVPSISYGVSKQLNLFWERTFNISVADEMLIEKSKGDFDGLKNNMYTAAASFGYGFYPDSRTSLFARLNYNGSNYIYTANNNSTKEWTNYLGIAFNFNYYISPQLQITGNFSMNYIDDTTIVKNVVQTNYNLGFHYAIF